MPTRADVGRRAEEAVADYLRVLGFELVGRNVRLGSLELDIVARRGALAVVVEVRTRGRTAWQGALASIDRRKQERLRRAVARLWRERLDALRDVARVRIDVAAVTFDGGRTAVEYIEDAIGPVGGPQVV